MPRLAPAVLVAIFALATAAVAQDAASPPDAPGAEDGRFSFHRVQDSFVRLDGRTGHVSVCGREATGWACRTVPDERSALEETIGRLQSDNATLKRELLARGLPLPSGVRPEPRLEPPAAIPNPDKGKLAEAPKLPNDAEIDRVMGFIEKIWRRMIDIMVELQRDLGRKG